MVECEDFEKRMRENPVFAEEVRAKQALHNLLINASRDSLEERLLKEYLAENPAAAEPVPAPTSGGIIAFPKGRFLLALAASLVLAAGLFWMAMGRCPLEWSAPRIVATAYRAHPTAVTRQQHYSEAQLASIATHVMDAVNGDVRKCKDVQMQKLRGKPLTLTVEEIFAGQISLTVDVLGKELWSENFASLNDLGGKVRPAARSIANRLMTLPPDS